MNIKKILLCIAYVAYSFACSNTISYKQMNNEELEEKYSDQKTTLNNTHYQIKNPLVIVAGASIYKNKRKNKKKNKNKNLLIVKKDMECLNATFKEYFPYPVVSNYDPNNIKSHEISLKQMKNFIDKQVIYLRNNQNNHDSIIFTWSGHGYDDGIITSDGKKLKSTYIRNRLIKDTNKFHSMPKLFIIASYRKSNVKLVNKNIKLMKNKQSKAQNLYQNMIWINCNMIGKSIFDIGQGSSVINEIAILLIDPTHNKKTPNDLILLLKQKLRGKSDKKEYTIESENTLDKSLNFIIKQKSKQPKNSLDTIHPIETKENKTLALDITNRIHNNKDNFVLSEYLENTGICYFQNKEYERALTFHQQALKVRKKLYPNMDHENIARTLDNIADALSHSSENDFEQALEYHFKALEVRKRIYKSNDHLLIAYSLYSVGLDHHMLGDQIQALKFHNQAFQIRKKIHNNIDHEDIVYSLFSIGSAYNKLGDKQIGFEYCYKSIIMMLSLSNIEESFINYFIDCLIDAKNTKTKY